MTDSTYHENPLIRQWAHARWELESEIFHSIESAPRNVIDDMRKSVESASTTNCWYSIYDVCGIVRQSIGSRDRCDALKAMG